MSKETTEILNLLQQQWGLSVEGLVSEEEIINRLAQRIVYYLEKGPETFFQLMYRLDISEKKLNMVLADPEAPFAIAKLVYDRQLQKIKSRAENKKFGAVDEGAPIESRDLLEKSKAEAKRWQSQK